MSEVVLLPTETDPRSPLAPAVGLYRLAFHCSENGIPCRVHDPNLHPLDDLIQAVAAGRYGVVGMAVSNLRMGEDLDLLWRLRQVAQNCGRPVLFVGGGQEAVNNARQWLDVGLDLICIGFAEETLLEVARRWMEAEAGTPLGTLYADMPGVSYLEEDGNWVYRAAPRIDAAWFKKYSADQLKRMWIDYPAYWDLMRSRRIKSFDGAQFIIENVRLFTTSHCPMGCRFCSSQTFVPTSYERLPILQLSAAETLDLVIDHAERYGAVSFQFNDDNFLGGHKPGIQRAMDFCDGVLKAKADGRLRADASFVCQTRVADFLIRDKAVTKPSKLNYALMDAMCAAGFRTMSLGVETFTDRLLSAPSMNKIGVCRDDCINVLDAFIERGVLPGVNLIFGIPESTPDDVVENIEMGMRYLRRGCDVTAAARMMAYPGAPVFGLPDYTIAYRHWTNPVTGQTIEMADYVVPWDPVIAAVADRSRPEMIRELAALKEEQGWKGDVVPKSLTAVSTFLAWLRLMGRDQEYAALRAQVPSLSGRTTVGMM